MVMNTTALGIPARVAAANGRRSRVQPDAPA
jgi:hypothetical protein